MPRPLCVDLDGTLVKSDTLMDSLLLLLRSNPLAALRLPLWMVKGKAALKARISSLVALDEQHLPYNRRLLDFLRGEKMQGRRLYLATGADERLARRLALHLGLFDDVLASDGHANLTGRKKLACLQERFGRSGFDYIGNDAADMPLLEYTGEAILANPQPGLRARLRRRGIPVKQEFLDRCGRGAAFLKAIRLHQWAKNILVFLPVLLAHDCRPSGLLSALLAGISFSLCASATYVVNDMLDIGADRRHPRKRTRPFAAGDLSVPAGVGICASSLAASVATAVVFLPGRFLEWLLVYLTATLGYSFWLKRVPLVDVILLAGLYTLRLCAGAAATRVEISPWLGAFSLFLFLSLAMVKRFDELQNTGRRGEAPANGRGYLIADLEQLRSFGTTSAYAAVVVFAFYIGGHDATRLYQHPIWLWSMMPVMVLWLSRIWLLASRGELREDPFVFAVTDRTSLLLAAALAVIAAAAAL